MGVLRESCEPSVRRRWDAVQGDLHAPPLRATRGRRAPRATSRSSRRTPTGCGTPTETQAQLGLSWSGLSTRRTLRASPRRSMPSSAPSRSAIPEPNLALSKPATANGSASPGRTAAQAFDGLTWRPSGVAGSDGGDYWLDVDLGSKASMSRMVVFHAGAGGENVRVEHERLHAERERRRQDVRPGCHGHGQHALGHDLPLRAGVGPVPEDGHHGAADRSAVSGSARVRDRGVRAVAAEPQ